MSHLYSHLRIHHVFGANTDVGKTILTAALVRASTLSGTHAFYLKPVSTGPPDAADDAHVARFAGPNRHLLHAHCLFRYADPVSPHLAARRAGAAHSDDTVLNAIAEHIRACARTPGHMYIETAGGVHSPTLSGTTQADSYRPLRLPTLLVGDPRLGGISATIAAYESLLVRGNTVDAVLLFRDDYYRNHEYLSAYFAERGIHLAALDPPPARSGHAAEDAADTEAYYHRVVPPTKDGDVFRALAHLDACHARRIQDLASMPRRAMDTFWWPFVQHRLVRSEKDVTVIDSAHGDFFSVYTPESPSLLAPTLDSSASWWTQAVGHAHPKLALAAAHAAGRYGHVMFPQATHRPALTLAERLLRGPGAGWAARAFFSDNGSTGMEVALKMAFRAFSVGRNLTPAQKKALWVVGLRGSYHGDTIGAMDATEEGVYTCEWHNAKGFWFDPPTVGLQDGEVRVSVPPSVAEGPVSFVDVPSVYNVAARLDTPLAHAYRAHVHTALRALQDAGHTPAALVLEPLVLGAGGMRFVDPLFQRILVDAVRDPTLALPVVFDEVFAGLYRLGHDSCTRVLGAHPDVGVYAKVLGGGVLPLAVTLASARVFRAFEGPSKVDALLHGHSYTAHAIGCEVANATLDMVEALPDTPAWRAARDRWQGEGEGDPPTPAWSFWDPGFVRALSRLDTVEESMALGCVLAIRFRDEGAGYASHTAQGLLRAIGPAPADGDGLSSAPGGASFGIHYRTLGNVAYFMTSLNTPARTVEEVENRLWKTLAPEVD